MRYLASLIAFAVYIAGIVIAKGFWWTLGAIFIPPISWYLVLERVLTTYGFLS